MFLIPKLILFFIFCFVTLNAFLFENIKVSVKSNQIHRHHVKGAVPLSSSYDVVTVDEEYPRSDATWWQIFADEKKFTPPPPPPADDQIQGFSSVLNVNAWRTAFVEEEPVVEKNESPPSLKEYFEGKVLGSKHLESIQGLWRLMKNRGSLKHLDAEDLDRVMEALRVAYISLWGKITMRSLEISINRARGTAAVLGELKTDVNIVLSAILSDVLAELTSAKQREQLSTRFGEDVIRLSESYNKLPVFMSRKAEYTDLQSENQIQVECS
jgi:HD domain